MVMVKATILCVAAAAWHGSQSDEKCLATIPDGINTLEVAFSQDGSLAAFVAQTRRGTYIVAGSWASPEYEFAGKVRLSRNGKHVTFFAFDGKESFTCVNDRIVARFDDNSQWMGVWPGSISGDGTVVAQCVFDKKRNVWSVAVNGKKGPEFTEPIGNPVLSNDGKRVAYQGGTNGTQFIVIDGNEGPKYEEVTNPALSADGSVLAYGARSDQKWFVHFGQKKLTALGEVHQVFMDPQGRHFGYVMARLTETKEILLSVVIGDAKGEEYPEIGLPSISSDGKLVCYRALSPEKQTFLVVGEKKTRVEDMVSEPVLDDQRKCVGYGVRIGRELRWRIHKAH